MPALVAGILALIGSFEERDVDGRDEPGHDEWPYFLKSEYGNLKSPDLNSGG
jgi:hypothetical protein